MRRLLLGILAAGASVALLFVGLAAYAGMWPPALVVESGSMQHSDTTSEFGVLDAGDIAVIQVVHSTADIVTYLAGRSHGYTSFGDYGDVIAFADPEPNETAILLHRVFTYVNRNISGGFDVPELGLLPHGDWYGISADGSNATVPVGLRSFVIQGMGWKHDLAIGWNLTALGANASNNGLLTFGDHNLYRATKRTDPWILPAAYIIARARAEIPWLGLIRLTIARSPEGCCASWGSTDPDVGAPANSWLALDIVLVAAFGTPIGVDFLVRRRILQKMRSVLRRRRGTENAQPASAGPEPASTARGSGGASRQMTSEEFDSWLRKIDGHIAQLRASARLRQEK